MMMTQKLFAICNALNDYYLTELEISILFIICIE